MDEIKIDEFKQVMNGIVLVYTNMCGTCKSAKMMLNIVSQSLPEIDFKLMNANYFPQLLESYQIKSIPCFLIIKNGELSDVFYAFHSVTYLFHKIKKSFN